MRSLVRKNTKIARPSEVIENFVMKCLFLVQDDKVHETHQRGDELFTEISNTIEKSNDITEKEYKRQSSIVNVKTCHFFGIEVV